MKLLLTLCIAVSVLAIAVRPWVAAKYLPAGKKIQMLDARPVAETTSMHISHTKENGVGLDLCGVCIQVSVIMVNELLNIIANEGILGECSTLCGKLPQKLEQEVCDAACIGLGLDEFIKILERTDIDPIYYCELVRLCPIVDCQGQCLTIRSLNVTPSAVALGKTVVTKVNFQVLNQTGTGMTRVDIYPSDDAKMLPLQQDFLEVGYAPGNYEANINIDTSEQTQFFEYRPGAYTVQVWFCEGECGSQHPHSKIYDVRNGTFVITN